MKLLITGGSGFLGKTLAKKMLADYGKDVDIMLVSRSHKSLFETLNAIGSNKVTVAPCDVANYEQLLAVFRDFRPDTVVHAAATKFVDWAEQYPLECVDNNVLGSKNVIYACRDTKVSTLVGISTDKAAPPIKNIYGLTKATMEKMFTLEREIPRTVCVRYGNVLWSTGSVLPAWEKMRERGEVIRSTGAHMTRFFFSVDEAADLVETAINEGENRSILSYPMKSCKIERLLNVFCENYGCKSEIIPPRPGERDYEVLIGESELPYAEKLENGLFIIRNEKLPDSRFYEDGKYFPPRPYTTENCPQLSDKELREYVKNRPC